MSKRKQGPIGFGRTPMPDEVGHEPEDEEQEKPKIPQLPPPLVVPIFVDDAEMQELFTRYNLHPLAPVGRFEYGLVQLVAALEKRVRQLDPDL